MEVACDPARVYQELRVSIVVRVWTWPTFGIMHDDWGCPILWLNMPQGAFLHMLRASQRRAFLRKIKPKRHDLGFLASVRQGLDLFASTWLARTKGAAKCTAWQLGLLLNYLYTPTSSSVNRR